MGTVMPDNVDRIKRYVDDVPLFSRFQIEHQIESAHAREVRLPSGGAIVIDHTEALTAVDINSARATKGADIEATAFNTNLEAAEEIARQLRLRDLGGLIVIDFIDMESAKNQRDVENRLRDSLRYDRARVQTAKISRFGLLELSRQRLQPSLSESNYIACPRCSGIGHIRGTESSALHILRIIQEEAMKESSVAIHVQVPVDVATFLLNEKRGDIHLIESRLKVSVTLIPNPHMETPNYSINRLRHDDMTDDVLQASYNLVEKPVQEKSLTASQEQQKAARATAVVQGITPTQPAPVQTQAPKIMPSLLGRVFGWFKALGEEEPQPKARPVASKSRNAPRHERGESGERGDGGKRRRERGEKKPAQAEAKAQEPRQQAEREPRPPKKPRPPRVAPVQQAEEKPALEGKVAASAAQSEEGSAPESARRRGRRGGRRERERRDLLALNGEATTGNAEEATGNVEAAVEQAVTASPKPSEYIAYPADYVPPSRPTEDVVYPEVSLPAEPVSVAAQPVVETAPEEVALEAAAPAAVVSQPLVAAVSVAATGGEGLIQIETDSSKLSVVAPVPDSMPAPRRRQRPREVYVENESLVQIETQRPPA